jgi:hypothetical protein
MGVFIGGFSWCLGQSWGSGGPLVRPAGRLGWPGGQVLLLHRLSHFGFPSCRLSLTRGESGFQKHAKPWPTGPNLARLGPCFVPHRSLVSYCMLLPLVLDIMKICMDFGPYDAFLPSDVPEMVNQQNSRNSLVISTYLLYLE